MNNKTFKNARTKYDLFKISINVSASIQWISWYKSLISNMEFSNLENEVLKIFIPKTFFVLQMVILNLISKRIISKKDTINRTQCWQLKSSQTIKVTINRI